jgi:exopolysaccharide biosynthesis predicted pyruvyltransferase EpsI
MPQEDDQMSLTIHRVITEEVLRELRNTSILFLPNTGNAGDSLINVGTAQCLDRLGIRYTSITSGSSVEGQVVLLGGGGNFVPAYKTIRAALQKFVRSAKRIVLLPHTIRGNEDLLEQLDNRVTIICRDVKSYRHVLDVCPRATVLLSHDMAFHVDVEQFLFSDESMEAYQQVFRQVLTEKKINLQHLQMLPRVFYSRGDGEKAAPIGGRDLDLSAAFALGTTSGLAERSAWCFLEMIRTSPPIVTDRLHVGIGAALLGKICTLHDNSYGKNSEVWSHSIKCFFPTVQFVPAESALAT